MSLVQLQPCAAATHCNLFSVMATFIKLLLCSFVIVALTSIDAVKAATVINVI